MDSGYIYITHIYVPIIINERGQEFEVCVGQRDDMGGEEGRSRGLEIQLI